MKKKKSFFSPHFILNMNTPYSLGKKTKHLSLHRRQTGTDPEDTAHVTPLSLCSHCCPPHGAPGRGSSYGTNPFNQTLTVRSWEQRGEPAPRAGTTILIAEVTAGKQGCYLRLLIPLNGVRNVWFLLFSANYLEC